MEDRLARTWVWASLLLQTLGYGSDAVWHGLLNPGVEPTTRSEMVRHLGTVHLPLYIGAASVLVSTSRTLLRQIRRSATGIALPIAVAGAMLSTAAEAWHAYSHLRLDTHGAPIAGVLSVIGFFVVVIAMALSRGGAGDAPPIRPTHGTPYNRSVRPRMLGRVRPTICSIWVAQFLAVCSTVNTQS